MRLKTDDIADELGRILDEHADNIGANADEFVRLSARKIENLILLHAGKPEFPLLADSVSATISLDAANRFIRANEEARQAFRNVVLGLIRGVAMVVSA